MASGKPRNGVLNFAKAQAVIAHCQRTRIPRIDRPH